MAEIKTKNKKTELLAPAGDFPSLASAINAGADAIYFGIKELNLRANAKNFELKEMKNVVSYCHKHNVKAYLALNSIVFENELKKIKKIINAAKKAKTNAIICWDLSVLNEAKKAKIPVHLSTQASASNSEAIKLYEKLGVKRFILARECKLKQIKEITRKTKAEIEIFVHGAMCMSVSGRCFISSHLFGKSANRGECLQPCRREYYAFDEEGNVLEIGNNYIMSPKDLCTISIIDKIMKTGVDAVKIEGRNRSPEYVSVATACYRKAIDAVNAGTFDKKLAHELTQELKSVYNRGFSTGFYLKSPTYKEFTDEYGSKANAVKEYLGYVKNFYKKSNAAEIFIERGSIKKGDVILVIGNTTGTLKQKAESMQKNGKEIMHASNGSSVGIKMNSQVRENDKVYVVKKK